MLSVFSNHYFFPFFQVAVLGLCFYAVYRDTRKYWITPSGAPTVTVTRGEESMRTLDKITGVVIAAIITIINKSVFDEDPTWAHYAAFFNLADIIAALYFCYFSSWGRNKIFGWHIRSKTD